MTKANRLTMIELSGQRQPLYQSMVIIDSVTQSAYQQRFIPMRCFVAQRYEAEGYQFEFPLIDDADLDAVFFYRTSASGEMLSALRVCQDSDEGLPITSHIADTYARLKRSGAVLAEPSRHAIAPGQCGDFRYYLTAAYQLARHYGIDAYLLQARASHEGFYHRFCNAQTLPETVGLHDCKNMIWWLDKTPVSSQRHCGGRRNDLEQLINDHGETR